MKTADVMMELRVDELKKLARQLDVDKTLTRKLDLITSMENQLRHNLPTYLAYERGVERFLSDELGYILPP